MIARGCRYFITDPKTDISLSTSFSVLNAEKLILTASPPVPIAL